MTDDTALTPAQQMLGDFAPALVHFTDDVLFGEVWPRTELSPRERSLVTVASLDHEREHRATREPPRQGNGQRCDAG